MSITLANSYFIKAIDNYGHDFDRSIEALNYALSYDEEHPGAHYLMGRIAMEYLYQYKDAASHFKKAIYYNSDYVEAYYWYITLLIKTEALDEARKVIEKALLVKGVSKAQLYFRQALIFEIEKQYEESKNILKTAIQNSYDASYTLFLKNEIERIKEKVELVS